VRILLWFSILEFEFIHHCCRISTEDSALHVGFCNMQVRGVKNRFNYNKYSTYYTQVTINYIFTIWRPAMYRTLIIFLVLFFIQSAFAQIPNASFENWTNGNPDGWFTSNNILAINVTQSTTAFNGSSAVRGEVVVIPISGGLMSPILQTGQGAVGFAVSQAYAGVTGNYQFTPVGGDKLALNFHLIAGGQSGTPVASGALELNGTSSGWQSFNVPFVEVAPGTPDWCILQILIVGPSGDDIHQGSVMFIDNLAFSNSTSVTEKNSYNPEVYSLQQNYPNPFNPSTSIQFFLQKASHVKLQVFNVLGKEVATLVNGYKEAGQHVEKFDATALASGVYFYRLNAENYSAMKQMLLIK
jgi:hypothetical protein